MDEEEVATQVLNLDEGGGGDDDDDKDDHGDDSTLEEDKIEDENMEIEPEKDIAGAEDEMFVPEASTNDDNNDEEEAEEPEINALEMDDSSNTASNSTTNNLKKSDTQKKTAHTGNEESADGIEEENPDQQQQLENNNDDIEGNSIEEEQERPPGLDTDNQTDKPENSSSGAKSIVDTTTTTTAATDKNNEDSNDNGERTDKTQTNVTTGQTGEEKGDQEDEDVNSVHDEVEDFVPENTEQGEGGDDDVQQIDDDSNAARTDNTNTLGEDTGTGDIFNLGDDEDETNILKISSTASLEDAVGGDGEEATTSSALQTDEKLDSDDEESSMPTIRVKQFGLFDEESDEEDEQMDQSMDPHELQGIMHVDMSDDASKNKDQEESMVSSRPRRRAAEQAANVIREISHQEEKDSRRKSRDFDDTTVSNTVGTLERHRCHVCKKISVCKITVQQYGQDILLCSTSCFNAFRNPDPTRRPLPCAKCGILQNVVSTYYWETMNFCSELCIGNYQMEIGAKCATCSKKVAWQSLGKYCVRFGSDVRQFCTASCLESYKKMARVCFHCQLDIKKLQNVILANIPSKQTPKEFCSQDCVEMYIEQNLHQTVRTKPNQNSNCFICSVNKPTFRELVLPTTNIKVCSELCWSKLLEIKNVKSPTKCEICAKFVNLEMGMLKPAFYVSTEKKIHGFCSATCKNVFVLRNRQILACTTCKVKKYNYDLIRHVNEADSPSFAVCSLNCIPKPSQYIINLRDTLTPAATASEMFNLSKSRMIQEKQLQATGTTATPSRIRTTIMSEQPNNKNNSLDKSSTDWNNSMASGDKSDGAIKIASVSSLAANNNHHNNNNIRAESNQDDIIEIYEESEEDGQSVDITDEEMEELLGNSEHFLVFPPKEHVEKKNKGCLVRPYTTTVASQTNEEGLNNLTLGETCNEASTSTGTTTTTPATTAISKLVSSGIRKKNSDGTITEYIPILIPVYIPFPFYGFDSPVPVPLPVPIPVPIPVPVIMPTDSNKSSSLASSSSTNITPGVVPCNVIPDPATTDQRQQQQQHQQQQQQQHQSLQQQQQIQQSMRNPVVDKDSSGEIPENMRLDSVSFLDLTGPNVGEADSFDILNAIPSLDMELDFDGTTGASHHSMHHGGHSMMNQPMSLMQSVVEGNIHSWQQQPQQPLMMPQMGMGPMSIPPMPKYTREDYAIKSWKQYFGNESDPWSLNSKILGEKLAEWVNKGRKQSGERFTPGCVLYLCLGIQEYLRRGHRNDKIFYDPPYAPFIHAFTHYAETSFPQGIVAGALEDHHFWESAELGVNGPEVLLFTLIYYNYKYFNLRTWQEHSNLMFNQISVTMRTSPTGHKTKFMTIHGLGQKNEIPEQNVSPDTTPHQQASCPIRIFEFYKYKCASDQGSFYKSVIPNCSLKGKWFSSNPLGQMEIYQMLIRAMMIKG